MVSLAETKWHSVTVVHSAFGDNEEDHRVARARDLVFFRSFASLACDSYVSAHLLANGDIGTRRPLVSNISCVLSSGN